jgi:hypothetical protein
VITVCINKGNWNHIKIIQKIPQEHRGEAQNQGTTKNSHIGHSIYSSECNYVTYKTFNMRNNVTCSINRDYRTAETLYTVKIWLVAGI